jgi:hypothetical protein
MTEEYEYSPPNEKSMPLFDTERGTGFSLTVFLYLCPLMDGEKQRIASRVRKLAVEVSLPNLQVRSVLLTKFDPLMKIGVPPLLGPLTLDAFSIATSL